MRSAHTAAAMAEIRSVTTYFPAHNAAGKDKPHDIVDDKLINAAVMPESKEKP